MSLNEKLLKYAELCVVSGINIQKGQRLVLQCPVEYAEFARMITEQAYKAGAKEVILAWGDEKTSRITYDYAELDVFEAVPAWKAVMFNGYAAEGAAFLSVMSRDPEIFKGVASEKLLAGVKASERDLKEYKECFDRNELQWNLIAVPNAAWAKKVFPDLEEKEAIDRLWDAIFDVVRLNEDNPIKVWDEHGKRLKEKSDTLNQKHFVKLRYKNSLGTDFTVGLQKDHIWQGGGATSAKGIFFFPNMPTEEVFTAPDCRVADGKVVSSMPLSYQGNLITNFSLTFKDGRVEDFSADEGYESLERLLNTDEGSGRLGEVALVPYDSPISNRKILFYNTLFDENASCHLALGSCYPDTIEGGEKMSKEQLQELGGNYSMNHVDFMIGTEDLSIIGIGEDGEETPVFENGNWAI